MREKKVVAIGVATVVLLGAAWHAIAQDGKAPYPSVAPLDQYLMARSAAPESISRDAEVLVLGRHGYETAIKGTNGFVCLVERSWTAPIDDPGFWNPKGRAPTCLNAAAARSYLPRTIKKTDLILAGRTKAQMVEAIAAAVDKKELPPMNSGAMCYMLSKSDPVAWGAGLPGSPIVAFNDKWEDLTVFLLPVRQWSDGTADR